MKSGRVTQKVAIAGALVLASIAGSAAQKTSVDEARLKKLDSGPATIDVSSYPPEQQKAYKLFQPKCSSCHVLARGVNTEMVLPGDWERYIKRMMYKPNSGISSADARTLFRFLVYDASVRKVDLLRKALAASAPTDRDAAVAKIKEVNPGFVAQ